jgi:hypothetical protein
MKLRSTLTSGALIAATALITAAVVSQDPPEQGHGMSDEMMQRWMKYAAPGEHHKQLERMVGTWDQTVRFWHGPGEEPTGTSPGTAEYALLMGGRFLKGDYRGTFADMPFEGMDIIGYDNFRQEYVSIWLDNMSTAFMITRGRFDAETNAMQLSGVMDDVMIEKRNMPVRTTTRFVDADTVIFEMFTAGTESHDQRVLEVISKRRK